jgi:hypothetical protein
MLVGDIITSSREIWPDLAAGGDADANGRMISAATAYRWLNEGLLMAGTAANGIYDTTGMASIKGQGIYTLTVGPTWRRITKGWFDGWEISLGNASQIFRRNTIPAITAMFASIKTANQVVIELYPQPNRTSGVTASVGAIGVGDTSIPCTDLSGFLLPQGLALLSGAPAATPEIIAYSNTGANTLTQITRGLGGTIPTAFNAGAVVRELNIRLCGFRMPVTNYAVGNKNVTLDVPVGWEPHIITYMESRFRRVEKEYGVADKLRDQFIGEIKALASQNKMVAGPRQMGGVGGNETYGSGLGGAWFIS